MTVKELIDELNKYPKNLEVKISVDWTSDVTTVRYFEVDEHGRA